MSQSSNSKRKGLSSEYTKYRKNACETCGAQNNIIRDADGFLLHSLKSKRLTVHHLDHNPFNNDPSNLQTLCRKCHDKVHNQ